MISFLMDLIKKHKLEIDIKDSDREKEIIEKIEYSAIGLTDFHTAMDLMTEIWNKQRAEELHQVRQHPDFQKNLQEVLSLGLQHSEDFLIHTRFIPISVVKINNNMHILNDKQISRISDLGFGIREFTIEKNDTIKDVYCTGLHPNVHPISKKFCFGINSMEFNRDSIKELFDRLSFANLNLSYLERSEAKKIGDIVSEKR